MDFNHAEGGSGLVSHGVDGEVEVGVVRKQAAHLEVRVVHQRG